MHYVDWIGCILRFYHHSFESLLNLLIVCPGWHSHAVQFVERELLQKKKSFFQLIKQQRVVLMCGLDRANHNKHLTAGRNSIEVGMHVICNRMCIVECRQKPRQTMGTLTEIREMGEQQTSYFNLAWVCLEWAVQTNLGQVTGGLLFEYYTRIFCQNPLKSSLKNRKKSCRSGNPVKSVQYLCKMFVTFQD